MSNRRLAVQVNEDLYRQIIEANNRLSVDAVRPTSLSEWVRRAITEKLEREAKHGV